MRFPDVAVRGCLLATLIIAAPAAAWAGAEQVRGEILKDVRGRFPSLEPADLAAGAAAFDAGRKLESDNHSPAPGSAEAIATGRHLWQRKFANGRSLSGCFPNGGRRIAASYPQVDRRLKRVVTLETAINQCLKAHGQPLLDAGDPETMGAVIAYVRSLAAGRKVSVRVNTALEEQRFEEGRRLYFTRMGQQNYACASCHVQHVGQYFADTAIPSAIGAAVQWPHVRNGKPETLQMRIRECLERMGAAPFPAGSDELSHLEYFLAYLSNGLPLRPNAWRPGPARGQM